MFSKISRPKWWLMYLLLPVLIGLLVIEIEIPISEVGHRVVEVGIVVLIFGLIELWFRANDANIRAGQWRATHGREYGRVIYTSQGQFVSVNRAAAHPSSISPTREVEAAPIEQGSESIALADNAVLEPIGSLSSLASKQVPYAKAETLGVFGFATRRS